MAIDVEKSDRVLNRIFLVMNALLWLSFCFAVIKHWHRMPQELHLWMISLAVVFPLLWHSMLKDRCGMSSLTGVSLAFLAIVVVSVRLF